MQGDARAADRTRRPRKWPTNQEETVLDSSGKRKRPFNWTRFGQRKREPEPSKQDDVDEKETAIGGMDGGKHQTAESNCVCVEPLNAEEGALVNKAMQGGADSEKVGTMKSGRGEIILYRGAMPGSRNEDKGFQGIKAGNMLGDGIMEMYTRLIVKRSRTRSAGGHVWCRTETVKGSLFYSKLTGEDGESYNYELVKNWNRRNSILNTDKILVPVHLRREVHWIMGCINLKDERFEVCGSNVPKPQGAGDIHSGTGKETQAAGTKGSRKHAEMAAR